MNKYPRETLVGAFMVIGLGCLVYLAVNLGQVSLWDDGTYRLNARFSKVTGLRVGNPVTLLGLPIGKVAALALDSEQQAAVVTMKIDKNARIYDDAIAAIKTEGLIGDKFVEIEAGGGGALLKPGGTITETVAPVDIGDLIGKYAFGAVDKK